jgi:sugar phosphate permease
VRFIFSGAIFISSVATMFMPICANVHWLAFCILQVIAGLAHGTIWPCLAVTIAHWAPINERGKLMGFMTAGNLFSFICK